MKIRINDRPDIQEIEVIINCVADDPLVNKIISALNTVDAKLLCRRQGETFQLGLADILYIESVDRKTFLYTEEQVYETDRRLYELEDYLKDHSFFRTSKTTIINLRRTKSIRPEIGARLLLTMDNQEKIIVSRQYAGSIKHALGVKGDTSKIYRRFFNCSHQRSYILCGHPFSLWSLFCWVRGLECGYSNAVYVKSIANPHPYEQLAVFPCCYAFLLAIRCWNCCAGLLLFGSMQEVTHSVDYERCALFPSLFPDEVRRCTW